MKICVIIPAKNEASGIQRTIFSVLAAGIPYHDIYVCDDGSDDGTIGLAVATGANTLRNPISIGKGRSIVAMAHRWRLPALYDAIALLDADTEVHPGYFKQIYAVFEKYPTAAAVCGRPKSTPRNALTCYRAFVYSLTHFIYKSGQNVMRVITVLPGCATVYRSDAFKMINWSDGTQVEDAGATVQLHKAGYEIRYAPAAIVYTQDPHTIRGYLRQMMRWNRGMFRVAKKYNCWTSWKRIDIESKGLLSEGIVFSTLMLMSLVALPFIRSVRWWICFDAGLTILSAAIVARAEKRWDILYSSLLFPFMKIIDALTFLYSAVSYSKSVRSGWISPVRY